MKKTLGIIAGVLGFLVVALCAGAFIFFRVSASPFDDGAGKAERVKISVPSGTSVRSVAKQLESDGVIKNAEVFYLAARFAPLRKILAGGSANFSLKSGVYEVARGMSYGELFEILSKGRDEYIRVMIPEGYTVSMIARELDSCGVCSFSSFMDAARDNALLASYSISSTSFEGYLFPDTYFFAPKMDATEAVRIMADNFFKRIQEIPELENLSPEKLNEKVTLASIVEREYRNADEAPLIASVFKNRYDRNIGLYSCATIVYIITEVQGRPHPDVVTYADLEIDSPYNTYKWAGLTPTPISNPGLVSLSAAANPPKTDYYFFRVSDPETGSHVFTKTLDSHINEGTLYTKRVR